MNARALALVLLATPAWPQGFAGLGTDAEGFSLPEPGPVFDFPADHGPHPDYRIEWWYVTANLTGPDGTPYGLQWTLFRSGLLPEERDGLASPQVWFGHAGLTTPDAHFATERFARGGIDQAGVQADPFEAHIDDWSLAGPSFDDLTMRASGPEFAYEVTLEAEGPLVFHGAEGFSVKSDSGQASYYYSRPRYAVAGVLSLPGGEVPVTGQAWLDREWSSQPLREDQTGWDWFSLSFDEGTQLMAYRLRSETGRDYTAATWIAADGTARALPEGAVTATPGETAEVAGRRIPVHWTLTWPEEGLDIAVEALNDAAWMGLSIPYWEGPVVVSGSHAGVGYLEMTGYE